ncbi:hypothetical protein B0I12_002577 [Microbacterium hydrothermale]|uniref:hypothetical protein n=1 Tax=Microbacterium hydrothermale TaxID=857427 RepID=UPI0022275492|nr:hypothetical protein [Microbacterium hydrothermale]MCW2165422.1 hypothetical protein [Microbacterium hydrothermale]
MHESTPTRLRTLSSETASHALAEWLVVETVADIRRRIAPGWSYYDRLALSALVRRALIDGNPLANAARSRLRLPQPRFMFSAHADFPSGKVEPGTNRRAHGSFSYSPTHPGEEHTMKQFLAAPVGVMGGEPVTVRALVLYFANVYGGVHHGKPSGEIEEFFQQTLVSLDFMRAMMFDTLTRIAVATADALDPIARAVEATPLTWPASGGVGGSSGSLLSPGSR